MRSREFTTLIRFPTILFITISFFWTSSCSRYVSYLESGENNDIQYEFPSEQNQSCSLLTKNNIIHDSPFTLEETQKLFQASSVKTLNIIEKGILLTAYQMYARPDATDWSSRTQIHLRYRGKEVHQEFGSFSKLPLLEALKTLENKSVTKRSLKKLFDLAYKRLPSKLTVQESFNLFLDQNKGELLARPKIVERYFKLSKPLQKGETFAKKRITIPTLKASKNKLNHGFYLADNFKCSFDAQLYQKGIFLISKRPFRENAFGLISPEGDYFFMVTKKIGSKDPSYSSQEFPGSPPSSISPFCQYIGNNQKMTLMGFNSRDPGQLLYHLYNYQIQNVKNTDELKSYLGFPRHQFLTNPSRLLYESDRGSEEQLRYFLSLDFPVYHVEKLGVIYTLFTQDQKTTFIGDGRYRTYQSCLN